MTPTALHTLCLSLPATSHVVQWQGADVYKVGDKVFAISRPSDEADGVQVTFKVSPDSYAFMKGEPGLRPAPHLASRGPGYTWIQQYERPGLSDEHLAAYITKSHALVAAGLTKKKRRELGLDAA